MAAFIDILVKSSEDGDPNEIREVYQNIRNKFEFHPQPFSLPDRAGLCLIDVNSGSDTRVLVKEVMKWERENREPGQED